MRFYSLNCGDVTSSPGNGRFPPLHLFYNPFICCFFKKQYAWLGILVNTSCVFTMYVSNIPIWVLSFFSFRLLSVSILLDILIHILALEEWKLDEISFLAPPKLIRISPERKKSYYSKMWIFKNQMDEYDCIVWCKKNPLSTWLKRLFITHCHARIKNEMRMRAIIHIHILTQTYTQIHLNKYLHELKKFPVCVCGCVCFVFCFFVCFFGVFFFKLVNIFSLESYTIYVKFVFTTLFEAKFAFSKRHYVRRHIRYNKGMWNKLMFHLKIYLKWIEYIKVSIKDKRS